MVCRCALPPLRQKRTVISAGANQHQQKRPLAPHSLTIASTQKAFLSCRGKGVLHWECAGAQPEPWCGCRCKGSWKHSFPTWCGRMFTLPSWYVALSSSFPLSSFVRPLIPRTPQLTCWPYGVPQLGKLWTVSGIHPVDLLPSPFGPMPESTVQ